MSNRIKILYQNDHIVYQRIIVKLGDCKMKLYRVIRLKDSTGKPTLEINELVDEPTDEIRQLKLNDILINKNYEKRKKD